jgi:3-phosphoglycerate kinase
MLQIKADDAAVKKFRESLSRLGDVFVNDAFGESRTFHHPCCNATIC